MYVLYSTPVLTVNNLDGSYRLVQDLRAINQIVQTCHPVVPNSYTLLSKIPYKHKWFSLVDPKDAFWAFPLDIRSRDLFAYQWENPITGRKQQSSAFQPSLWGCYYPIWDRHLDIFVWWARLLAWEGAASPTWSWLLS